jgi:ABC-type transport system involved in multi-copper enzyme maturation permease subunit
MVLLNFFLGLFVFVTCLFGIGTSFLYGIFPMMRGQSGQEQTTLKSAKFWTSIIPFGISSLGLILSGSTLWNGSSGLSVFLGVGTFPLLGLVITLIASTISLILYSLYKKQSETVSLWESFKRKVDWVLALFGGQDSNSNSYIKEFESSLEEISNKSNAFATRYENNVSEIINQRNQMEYYKVISFSDKSVAYLRSIAAVVPKMQSIVQSISVYSNPNADITDKGLDLTPELTGGQPKKRSLTFEELKNAITSYFKGSEYNPLVSSNKKYIIKSREENTLEKYLGDWAKNQQNCYLHCTGLYAIEGNALNHLLQNTPLNPLFNIEYMEKPTKEFTAGAENKSIEGQILTLNEVQQKVSIYNMCAQQGQQNQPSAPPVNFQPKQS